MQIIHTSLQTDNHARTSSLRLLYLSQFQAMLFFTVLNLKYKKVFVSKKKQQNNHKQDWHYVCSLHVSI